MKPWFTLSVALVVPWLTLRSQADLPFHHAGPLSDRFVPPIENGVQWDLIGPIVTLQTNETGQAWAIRPLISHTENSEVDSEEWDVLYPLLTVDRYGSEYRAQIGQLLNVAGGSDQEGDETDRFTVFPLFFLQRSEEPGENYWALLPVYGDLKGRFFRDRVQFVLFPLYVKTWKKDVVTWNVPVPFFHIRKGEGLEGWQLWPLVGSESKAVTTRTALFGDEEIVGGHKKVFVLWPFFFNQRTGIGTDNPTHHQVLLPFYSRLRSPNRDSSTYFWPFGVTVTDDREKGYRELGAPWPLVVFARGEGKTANRVWPFFSRARTPVLETRFYLWPMYHYKRVQSEPLDRERSRVLFFLWSAVNERNTETGTVAKRRDFWPLYHYQTDHEGNERRQILALMEPILPNNDSMTRNYSALWSIYRSESNPETGKKRQSFLWNLFHRQSDADSKRWSFLFGLLGREKDADGTRWRVLYIPFGKKAEP